MKEGAIVGRDGNILGHVYHLFSRLLYGRLCCGQSSSTSSNLKDGWFTVPDVENRQGPEVIISRASSTVSSRPGSAFWWNSTKKRAIPLTTLLGWSPLFGGQSQRLLGEHRRGSRNWGWWFVCRWKRQVREQKNSEVSWRVLSFWFVWLEAGVCFLRIDGKFIFWVMMLTMSPSFHAAMSFDLQVERSPESVQHLL